jgi:hypothetical protein
MLAALALMIEVIHWGLIAYTRLSDMPEAFGMVFLQPSPVLLFFTLLDVGVGFAGETSSILLISLLFNVTKYFILVRALREYGIGFVTGLALAVDIGYLATSGIYLLYYSYL